MKVVTIGRDGENDVVVNDPKVSRYHLQIIRHDDGHYTLSDFGSTNGTKLNGKKISGEVRLSNYDVVKIGDTILPWQSYFKDTLIDDQPEPSNRKGANKWFIVLGSVLLFAVIGLIILGRMAQNSEDYTPNTDHTTNPNVNEEPVKANEGIGSINPEPPVGSDNNEKPDYGLKVTNSKGNALKYNDAVYVGETLYVSASKKRNDCEYTQQGLFESNSEAKNKYKSEGGQVTVPGSAVDKTIIIGYGPKDPQPRQKIKLKVKKRENTVSGSTSNTNPSQENDNNRKVEDLDQTYETLKAQLFKDKDDDNTIVKKNIVREIFKKLNYSPKLQRNSYSEHDLKSVFEAKGGEQEDSNGQKIDKNRVIKAMQDYLNEHPEK